MIRIAERIVDKLSEMGLDGSLFPENRFEKRRDTLNLLR